MKNILLLAVLLVSVGCRHKAADPNDVYREVPEQQRESLRAAVRQLVEFQRSADWEKMYAIAEEPRDEKEQFVRRRTAARGLKDFVPTNVTWVPDGWVVGGCGVYQPRGNEPEALVSSVHAKPNPAKGGEWQFGAVIVDVVPGAPGGMKPCSPPGARN